MLTGPVSAHVRRVVTSPAWPGGNVRVDSVTVRGTRFPSVVTPRPPANSAQPVARWASASAVPIWPLPSVSMADRSCTVGSSARSSTYVMPTESGATTMPA